MELAIDLITKFLGDRLTKLLKTGADRITDEVSQIVNNRILEYLHAEYNSNYKTKTILNKVEPIELDKFYQPLFLRRTTLSYPTSLNQIEKYKNRIATKHLKYLFSDDKNCITIIGTAGSGKSTLVKYLYVDSIKNEIGRAHV